MTLLIVEDNQTMRRLLRRMVADLADDVRECEDGAQAFEAYRQCRPDWVLMDLEMPQMGGLAATRQILAAFPDARVLIVTQYDDEQMRASAREAGACGYVLKDDLSALLAFFDDSNAKLPE